MTRETSEDGFSRTKMNRPLSSKSKPGAVVSTMDVSCVVFLNIKILFVVVDNLPLFPSGFCCCFTHLLCAPQSIPLLCSCIFFFPFGHCHIHHVYKKLKISVKISAFSSAQVCHPVIFHVSLRGRKYKSSFLHRYCPFHLISFLSLGHKFTEQSK